MPNAATAAASCGGCAVSLPTQVSYGSPHPREEEYGERHQWEPGQQHDNEHECTGRALPQCARGISPRLAERRSDVDRAVIGAKRDVEQLRIDPPVQLTSLGSHRLDRALHFRE